MPETMSIERRKVLGAYGAKLVLTEGAKGMSGAIAKAKGDRGIRPEVCVAAAVRESGQPGHPRRTTGPEIWDDTDGKVDIFVSGVGRAVPSPAYRATSRRRAAKQSASVAVEPSASPVLTQKRAGFELKPGPHRIQGIGAGFVPGALDLSLVDDMELVTNEDAVLYARRLAREEGIISGISSGAAVAVAVRLAQKPETRARPSW